LYGLQEEQKDIFHLNTSHTKSMKVTGANKSFLCSLERHY